MNSSNESYSECYTGFEPMLINYNALTRLIHEFFKQCIKWTILKKSNLKPYSTPNSSACLQTVSSAPKKTLSISNVNFSLALP